VANTQLATVEAVSTPPRSKTPRKPVKRLTQEEVGLVLKLSRDGLTQVQIAQRLGCDQKTVSNWLKDLTDTTDTAKSYLRGQSLKMAQNIVRKGRATDHVAALKGLSVLQEDRSAGLVVQIGIKDSDVQVSLGGTTQLSPVPRNDLSCGKDSQG
jgi:hypothetical protein